MSVCFSEKVRNRGELASFLNKVISGSSSRRREMGGRSAFTGKRSTVGLGISNPFKFSTATLRGSDFSLHGNPVTPKGGCGMNSKNQHPSDHQEHDPLTGSSRKAL